MLPTQPRLPRDERIRLEILADFRECSNLGTLLDAHRKRRDDPDDTDEVALPERRR